MRARQRSISAVDLERRLEPARRRLQGARLRVRIGAGFEQMLWWVVAAAGVEAIGGLAARMTVIDVTGPLHLTALGLIVMGVLIAFVPALLGRGGPSHWRAVSERLDAAQDDHNRIATALALCRDEADSPFARAAVEQGEARLREISDRPPMLPTMHWRRRRNTTACVLMLSLCVLAVLIDRTRHAGPQAVNRPMVPDNHTSGAGSVVHEDEPTPSQEREGRPRTDRPPDAAAAGRGSLLAMGSARPETDGATHEGSPTLAASGRDISRGGRLSGSVAEGDNREQTEPHGSNADRVPRPETSKPTSSASKGETRKSSQGRIAGGSPGSGRTAAIENTWQQREATGEGDADSDDGEAEAREETDGSQQRGGVQPAMPDRTQAPSRELGITGPKSKRVGTGRGGPSPVKKARGAASLLMGVPMPDFVRGRSSPGHSAVTQEKMAPMTFGGEAVRSHPARARSTREAVVNRFEVPWSDAAAVQSYLTRWHELGTAPLDDALIPQTNGDTK